MRSVLSLLTLVFASSLLPVRAGAQWQPGAVALTTAANAQQIPRTVSDGAGGAIVAWQDLRSGDQDVYVRRVSSSGAVQWTADGVPLCTAANAQSTPVIVSDGAGGAIVAWNDERGGASLDVYAQRVDAAGSPLWAANGVALTTASDDQVMSGIVSDGAGGAIVVWHDRRTGTNYDIYAQRVNAAGIPQWTAGGLALCTASGDQSVPAIAEDGAGGAIVAWEDVRSVSNYDIYAQRVNASGVLQWTTDGVAVCDDSSGQITPTLLADGSGGVVAVWLDGRNGLPDVYSQRVNAFGTLLWTAGGVALCTAASFQTGPAMISDGAGGAIVTWFDIRNGSHYDVYARRVTGAGVPQWASNGVALCTAPDNQYFPRIVSDDAGGAIVTWSDYRSSTILEIYAQRVSGSGVPLWTAGGTPLCTSPFDQGSPDIVEDGAGGSLVGWEDYRGGASDIYIQRVDASGQIPTPVAAPSAGPAAFTAGIHPNPCAGPATIDFVLTGPSAVRVEVFDVAGRSLRTMAVGNVAGSRRVHFDGRGDSGHPLPGGVYLVRVNAGERAFTSKLVIAR